MAEWVQCYHLALLDEMVQQAEDHLVIYPGAGKQLEGLFSLQCLVIDDEQIQPNVLQIMKLKCRQFEQFSSLLAHGKG